MSRGVVLSKGPVRYYIMKLTYNSRTGLEIGNKLLKDGPGPKMPEIFFDAKLSSGKFRLEVPAL